MLLITGIRSISVNCYDSIYVMFLLLPTCNIYRDLIVVEYYDKKKTAIVYHCGSFDHLDMQSLNDYTFSLFILHMPFKSVGSL